MLRCYIAAMRPRQWIKNIFVFVGIIFSANLTNTAMLAKVAGSFAIFCLVSGAVYLINDIADAEKDRNHPEKKNRPLAAGLITAGGAAAVAAVITAVSLSAAFILSVSFGIITSLYFASMILYSFYIKDIIILDVFIIALGFVLRVIAGTEVIDVYLSPWAVVCTFFLALFLALGKRRSEKITLGDEADSHRVSLGTYTLPLIDQMISIVTTSTIVSYFLYTFKFSQHLVSVATIPFVVFGLFRYLYLVYNKNSGGSPEELALTDRPLQISIILWIIASLVIYY